MFKLSLPSGGRYPVLRAIAIIYVIAAAAVAIAGVVAAVWMAIVMPFGPAGLFGLRGPLALLLVTLAATFFAMVTLLAVAEVLKLFIDIEHNSRIAALGVAASRVEPQGAAAGAQASRISTLLAEETAELALIRGH